MIRAGALVDDAELHRFRNEAEAVAALDHPGIVPVYEVGDYEGQPYFSMKLIEGGSLAGLLEMYRHDPRAVARLSAEAAEAVAHAHARGILHRDIKPANLLVNAQGHVLVTDFGLAKRIGGDIELTTSGAPLGTPAYMSPEQARGLRGTVTTATDVYGLGAVLYAMLTGRPPFGGSSILETLEAVKERSPEPPRRLNPGIPADLETVCLKCLEKRPEARYASAQALAADLRAWLAGEPITARPVGRLERAQRWCRRKPAQAALLFVLAALAIGGPLVAWQQARLRREADLQRQSAERGAYNAQLGRVARLLDTSPAEARDLLDDESRFPIPLREFTWRALRHRYSRKERVLEGHRDLVASLVFSQDSGRLASVDWTGEVKLWDARNGQELKALDQPKVEEPMVQSVRAKFRLPHGRWLLAGLLTPVHCVWLLPRDALAHG